MRVTSKGQVTIPADIREAAGMLPGSEVMFTIVDGRVMLDRVASGGTHLSKRDAELLDHLERHRGLVPAGWDSETLMRFTRGEPAGNGSFQEDGRPRDLTDEELKRLLGDDG